MRCTKRYLDGMQIKVLMGTCYPYDEKKVRGGVEAVALNLVQALGKRNDIELHVGSFTQFVKRAQTEKRDRVVG